MDHLFRQRSVIEFTVERAKHRPRGSTESCKRPTVMTQWEYQRYGSWSNPLGKEAIAYGTNPDREGPKPGGRKAELDASRHTAKSSPPSDFHLFGPLEDHVHCAWPSVWRRRRIESCGEGMDPQLQRRLIQRRFSALGGLVAEMRTTERRLHAVDCLWDMCDDQKISWTFRNTHFVENSSQIYVVFSFLLYEKKNDEDEDDFLVFIEPADTPFFHWFRPMFHNYSAANSAVRHWAKPINKLYQIGRSVKQIRHQFVNCHRKFGVVHYYRNLHIVCLMRVWIGP